LKVTDNQYGRLF